MKKITDFKKGQLVYHPAFETWGIVRLVANNCIKVEWEDGQTGLLFFDGHVADARVLEIRS